jgi:hypothetical protein
MWVKVKSASLTVGMQKRMGSDRAPKTNSSRNRTHVGRLIHPLQAVGRHQSPYIIHPINNDQHCL